MCTIYTVPSLLLVASVELNEKHKTVHYALCSIVAASAEPPTGIGERQRGVGRKRLR